MEVGVINLFTGDETLLKAQQQDELLKSTNAFGAYLPLLSFNASSILAD
jgi:hypothetical protein